jgi:hypothetical protein
LIDIQINLLGSNDLKKPYEVFLKPCKFTTTRAPSEEVVEIDTSGLIDYVDFGLTGNLFLISIGVLREASGTVLATLLVDRQATFFANSKRSDSDKVRAYLECLSRLQDKVDHIDDLSLIERLHNEPWCLGFMYNDDNSEQIFRIDVPTNIYLVDDPNLAAIFRPWCSPIRPKLDNLYLKFGSRWLRDSVQTESFVRGIIIFLEKISKDSLLMYISQYHAFMSKLVRRL